jgi:hypothetical protein
MRSEPVWIVVLNATRARILRSLPEDGAPARTELALRSEHRRLKRVIADGGPVQSPGGGAAPDRGVEALRYDQVDFLRRVVDLLATHLAAGDFDGLAVFAEPRTLDLLSEIAPPFLARRIVVQRPLNLIHLPPPDLATAVSRALRNGDGSDRGRWW